MIRQISNLKSQRFSTMATKNKTKNQRMDLEEVAEAREAALWLEDGDEEGENSKDEVENLQGQIRERTNAHDEPERPPDFTWPVPLWNGKDLMHLLKRILKAMEIMENTQGVLASLSEEKDQKSSFVKVWSQDPERLEAAKSQLLSVVEFAERDIATERRRLTGRDIRWAKTKVLNPKMVSVLEKRKREHEEKTKRNEFYTEEKGIFFLPPDVDPRNLFQDVSGHAIDIIKEKTGTEIDCMGSDTFLISGPSGHVEKALDKLQNVHALYILETNGLPLIKINMLDPPSKSNVRIQMTERPNNMFITPETEHLKATFEELDQPSKESIPENEAFRVQLQKQNVERFHTMFLESMERIYLWRGRVDLVVEVGRVLSNVKISRSRNFRGWSKFVTNVLQPEGSQMRVMNKFSDNSEMMQPLIDYIEDCRKSGPAPGAKWPKKYLNFHCFDKRTGKKLVIETEIDPDAGNVIAWNGIEDKQEFFVSTMLCLQTKNDSSWQLTGSYARVLESDKMKEWNIFKSNIHIVNGHPLFTTLKGLQVQSVEQQTVWSAYLMEHYIVSVTQSDTYEVLKLAPADMEIKVDLKYEPITERSFKVEIRHEKWKPTLDEHLRLYRGQEPSYDVNPSVFFGSTANPTASAEYMITEFFGEMKGILLKIASKFRRPFISSSKDQIMEHGSNKVINIFDE